MQSLFDHQFSAQFPWFFNQVMPGGRHALGPPTNWIFYSASEPVQNVFCVWLASEAKGWICEEGQTHSLEICQASALKLPVLVPDSCTRNMNWTLPETGTDTPSSVCFLQWNCSSHSASRISQLTAECSWREHHVGSSHIHNRFQHRHTQHLFVHKLRTGRYYCQFPSLHTGCNYCGICNSYSGRFLDNSYHQQSEFVAYVVTVIKITSR